MTGLLDVPEHDRQVLREITFGSLVWYPEAPAPWDAAGYPGQSLWVWLNAKEQPDKLATVAQVEAVYRLQRAGLVRPTRPGLVTVTTSAGMRLITALDADGWQPPDRAPLAIAAAVRKATPRPRKRRAS